MAQTQDNRTRRWTGKPWLARGIKLVAWLAPIAVSIIATHVLARLIRRPEGTGPTVAWFLAMGIIATGVLFLVDKLARRLLPLAALFQLSLVFPDRAPSRYKAALRTRTVHQLQERVAEIRSSGLSDDPAIAAETLIELIADLSAHDRLTRGHAERVRAYSQMIGEELNLKDSEVDLLQWAGLLHDVGKMFVPDEILNKPGRLTDGEFDIIKKHPEWGAQLCEPLRGWLGDWVDAVGQHHERWDGKGYPAGIAGTDISLAARIVSVADVFDVITSIRSYKDATSPEEARKELAACAGTQFDEKIVRAFLNVSLGKLRLAMGPLSWLAQLPIIGRATLLPVAGTAASVVLTAGGLMAGNSLDAAPEYERARVEAAAPALTVASTVPPIATTLPPLPNETAAASTILESTAPASTVPQTAAPQTTAPEFSVPATTTTTTAPPPVTAPPTTIAPPPPATTPASTTVIRSPIANDDVATVTEGAFVDLDLGRNDQWVDSLLPLTSPTSGQLTQLSPTVVRFQAMGDFFGVDSFVYEARGRTGPTDTATVTVTVINVPDAPTAVDDEATTTEYSAVNIDVLANDSDADGDALTITGVSSPQGIATTDGRSIDYSPTGESAGVHTILYSVSDGTGLSDTATVRVTVNAVNRPPVLSPIGPRTVNEGSTLAFIAAATDPDLPADRLTFSMKGAGGPVPPGATIDPVTGRFVWTPSESDGGSTYNFRIVVTDDGSPPLTDEKAFTITVGDVNSPPVLQAIGDRNVDELTTLSFAVSASDPDLPADTLTLSATGLPTGATFAPSTGAFNWTPTQAQSRAGYDVTFLVTDDGTGTLTDSETITITVNDTNTAPVLAAIGNRSVDELAPLSFTVSASDANLPADTLTLSSSGLPVGATFNTSTGAFSWTPTEAQGPGSYNVTFTVTDDGTGTLSDSETITITVNDTNTAPVLTGIGDKSVDELLTLSFTVSASDADLPADTLTLSATGLPTGATFVPTTGAFSWSPTEAQGPNTFDVTFTVTDDGAGTLTDTETITITVTEANTAPVLAAIGNRSIDELTPLSFTVSASDADLPANALTLSATGLPTGATFTPSTGAFTWTPTETQGPGSFDVTFTVTDDGTGTLTDTETITITVSDVNSPPTLTAIGDRTVDELTALSFTVSASDADLPANALTLSATGLPAGSTFTPLTGAFTWTPTEAQGPGSYNVTFTVTDDGTGTLTDTETITITVNEVNTPPVLAAIGDQAVDEFAALSFTVSATDTDLPANALTLSATGLPAGSTFTPLTGAFTWTPTEAQGPGSYNVTFTVTDDGTGTLTDTETITITVAEVNNAPVFSDPGAQFNVINQAVTLPLVALDPDSPANDLVFSAVGLPTGLGIDPSTGVVSGTPTAAGSGTVTVTVTETNGVPTNLSDSGSFNWSITNSSSSILISEIATSGAGGAQDEFIELYNPTGAPVIIGGWKVLISGGNGNALATITVPGGRTIGANEYFLLAHTASTVSAPDLSYATNMPTGAGVALVTPANAPVDAVGTGPAPWKDGSGSLYGEGTFLPPLDGDVNQSYERRSGVGNCIDTGNNSADFFHNMTSRNPQGLGTFEACGTPPPFIPPPPASHVVISEFRLDGAEVLGVGGGDNEFVEIYNPTPGPINISGYRLYSQDGSLQATVPPLTTLPSGKHYLFASASFTTIEGIVPDVVSAGGIKNGEGVYLQNSGGGLVDSVSTGGASGIYLEGTALPPITGRVIHSYERLVGSAGGNCVDTDDNSADFFHNLSSQNPQRLSDPAVGCAT